MGLTRNSGLDPIADGLLIEPKPIREFGHRPVDLAREVGHLVEHRARATFGEPLEAVVGNQLPRRCVCDERTEAWPNTGVTVKRAQPDAHLPRIFGIAREEVRAALAAEALLEATVGVTPALDQVRALGQPEGAAASSAPAPRRRCRYVADSGCSGSSRRAPASH